MVGYRIGDELGDDLEMERILPHLHRTADRHWHITLHESECGGLDLVTPRGPRFSLSKFEFGIEE